MTTFKIIFPSGYIVEDTENDNIDINIILPDETVYFGTLFTPRNYETLMERLGDTYFWAVDMVVVKNLEIVTIKQAIKQMFEQGYFENIFCKIGTIHTVYEKYTSYDDIEAV